MVGYSFTVEEIEDLLPEISFLMEEAMAVYLELKETYTKALKVKSVTKNRGERLLTHNFPHRKQAQVLNEELNDILEEIEELGGTVRDIEKGIIDFPGTFEGKEIYYCWKVGDERIENWHYEEEGSTRRRKIFRIGE